MRDKIKSNGLRSCIEEIVSEIPEYKNDINTEKRIEIKNGLKRMLFTMMLEKTIAHYSVGDDKKTVTAALLETIPAFEDSYEYKEIGQYYEFALWLISLGVLCNIEQSQFEKITSILQREGVNDKLVSTIVQQKQASWPSSNANTLWEKPYNSILTANSISDVKTYLDKYWYQENTESYWHNMHKNTKVNNYFGYWSWEAAALVKAKGWNDSALKNQKYYPYDAVHW
jgi:hypothetical protein